ncbi:MAG: hypothetical protein KF732_07240 [Flavobacteriales bacterium]|nr:hypothetical protein [Flavobacteriales bacterium]
MLKFNFIFLAIITLLISFSCRKDEIITDKNAKVSFSTDTLIVDTVFTTIGSTTRRLVVYNRNDQRINISTIAVGGGSNSQFRINVDGVSGNIHHDVEIEANDSLFIFIEVTIDPNNTLSPFVVEDAILFVTNGNQQSVQLVAWGQNAHYFTPKVFPTNGLPNYSCLDGNCDESLAPINQTWVNDKPYVIYGYLVIDSADVLTINSGVRVHLYNKSGIWVYKGGNLNVNGTKDEPVTFQGTRLDYSFKDVPGQWDRIWINDGSINNTLNYAIIKNAFIGIQAETSPFEPNTPISANKLILNNCVINNSSGIGLYATNYRIESNNTIISNCGQYNFLVSGGGIYNFNHATIANYWSGANRQTPAVYAQNYYQDINGNIQVRNIDSLNIKNSIIYGNIDNEFALEAYSPGVINYNVSYSVVKTTYSWGGYFNNVVINPSNSLFVDAENNNFHITSTSPANNIGIATSILLDYDGVTRNNPPDAGAFEN